MPHGASGVPCTVGAEDLAEAVLDLLRGATAISVVNLSELAEEIAVEWVVATGAGDALRRPARKRLAALRAAVRAKLGEGGSRVHVTPNGTWTLPATPAPVPTPAPKPSKVKAEG